MKWVLASVAGFFGLILICCLGGFFVAIPRVRDEIEDDIQDGVATEIARQIPAVAGASAQPGEYVITEQSLQDSLRANQESRDDDDDSDLVVRIDVNGISVGVTGSSFTATYSGVPAAENGEFVMHDMDTDSKALGFILSPERFGRAISDAVNGYLVENGLRLESLELQPGQMVLVTVAS